MTKTEESLKEAMNNIGIPMSNKTKNILTYVGMLIVGIAISILTYPLVGQLIDWLRGA